MRDGGALVSGNPPPRCPTFTGWRLLGCAAQGAGGGYLSGRFSTKTEMKLECESTVTSSHPSSPRLFSASSVEVRIRIRSIRAPVPLDLVLPRGHWRHANADSGGIT